MGRIVDEGKGLYKVVKNENANQPVTLDQLAEVEATILKHLEEISKALKEKTEDKE